MAHLRDLVIECMMQGCTSRAVVELFNKSNAPCGRFCRKHGKQRLAQLKKIEDEHENRQAGS